MLTGRIRRRALALLGALLLVILVWPPCCVTMPAGPPLSPWEVVPPARPHPAASMLPVPLQNYPTSVVGSSSSGSHLKRSMTTTPRDDRQDPETPASDPDHQYQRHSMPSSPTRSLRSTSELDRFLRVLNPNAIAVDTTHRRSASPNERRHLEVNPQSEPQPVAGVSVRVRTVPESVPSRENSPGAVAHTGDYLIEPFGKNKSRLPPNGDVHSLVPPLQWPPAVATGDGDNGVSVAVGDSVTTIDSLWRWWWWWCRRQPAKFDDTPSTWRTPIDHPASPYGQERGDTMSPGAPLAASQSQPPSVVSRSKRNAPPASGSGNPHRHQHQLPAGGANGTAAGHNRRGGAGRHSPKQSSQQQQTQQQQQRNNESNLDRNERSANLSHISGATRKIQLFIKNRYIQLLPDGTVNGTHDDLSDYSEYAPTGPLCFP